MTRNRGRRLIGGWALVVLGAAILLGGISLYVGTTDSALRAAGFVGVIAGVVAILWGHGIVQRVRNAYLDDRLDALEGRVAALETSPKDPTDAPEDPRGP